MDIIIKIKNYINRNRLLFILFAIIISTVCSMLVHFANVEENSHWYNALWHTLQVFVFSASLPIDGPWYAFYPLICFHFIIPLATISFINEMFDGLININNIKYNYMTDHIVIAGLGKTGDYLSRQFAQNTTNKKEHVLVIDNNAELIKKNASINENIKYLIEDIGRSGENTFIERANIEKAKLFITLTGNDFANIDAACLLEKQKQKPYCFIQISNLNLLHTIRHDPSKYFNANENKIHIINSYEIVARYVVNDILLRNNQIINSKEVLFVIAGFGNFGKMIFEQITIQQTKIKTENYSIQVIDTKPDIKDDLYFMNLALNRILNQNNNIQKILSSTKYLNLDIQKMDTWEGVFNENEKKQIIVIIATDDDTKNLIAAIRIQKIMEIKKQEINLVCRFFRNPLIILEMPNIIACTFSEIFNAELKKMIEKEIKK